VAGLRKFICCDSLLSIIVITTFRPFAASHWDHSHSRSHSSHFHRAPPLYHCHRAPSVYHCHRVTSLIPCQWITPSLTASCSSHDNRITV